MLNRQIQVKISLLGLTGTANVSEVFPNVPGEINFGVPFRAEALCSILLTSLPHGVREERGGEL